MTIIPRILLDLKVAYMIAPVKNISFLTLLHLLHLPHETASSLQLPFIALGDENLRQLTLERRGRMQRQVVLYQGAGRQRLSRLVVLDRDGYGRTFANTRSMRRFFEVVMGGAVAAFVGGGGPQGVPLDPRELHHPRVGVIVKLFVRFLTEFVRFLGFELSFLFVLALFLARLATGE